MQVAVKQELGVAVVVALLSIITFFGSALVIPQVATAASGVLWLILLGSLWGIATVVAFALSSTWWVRAILITVPAVSLIVAGAFHSGSLGGAVLLIMALLLAQRIQQRDVKDRITYRVSTVFSGGLRLTVIGFLLAVAGLSLPFVEQAIRDQGLQVSESHVNMVVAPLEPLLNQLVPGTAPTASIDDLIDQQVAAQLPPGTELTETQRAQIRQQIASQFELQQEVSGSETLTSVVTNQVNRVLGDFTERQALLVTLAIVVLVFLGLRPFVPLLVLLLLPFVSGLVWLLRKVRLVVVEEQTVPVQRLTFSKEI